MKTALVLSGGVGLGVYQAGAYAALHDREDLRPQHLAGTSIGAINAALIAGGPVEDRVGRLQRFWASAATEANPFVTPWVAPFFTTSWRHASSWMSALQVRLFGRPGLFTPRLPDLLWQKQPSLYDLRPLRATLDEFIDFDHLNGGGIRVSVTATDARTGEGVTFDTAAGDRIGADHLLASCGFFPDFPPLEIDERSLADGGFSANAPIEAGIIDADGADIVCFLVDLFSAQGVSPRSIEEGSSRQWELLFGNQSRDKLRLLEREHRLRGAVRQLAASLGAEFKPDAAMAALASEPMPRSVSIFHIAYRPRDYEAGPEKTFDFSPDTLRDRWTAGFAAMQTAIDLASSGVGAGPGFYVHAVSQELAERYMDADAPKRKAYASPPSRG
jgi:NTE family protein